MRELLITDFIKSRTVQLCLGFGLALDLLFSKTINHAVIMFCLPYGTSIALHCLMSGSAPSKPQARISEQYRRPMAGNKNIKITPNDY